MKKILKLVLLFIIAWLGICVIAFLFGLGWGLLRGTVLPGLPILRF